MQKILIQNLGQETGGQRVRFSTARGIIYVIILFLAFLNIGLNSSFFYLFAPLYAMISILDVLKMRYKEQHRLFIFLTFLSYVLATLIGVLTEFSMYTILFFMWLVEYYMVVGQKGIYGLVLLIYLLNISEGVLNRAPWKEVFLEALMLSSLLVFAFVLIYLMIAQKQQREEKEALQVQMFQREKMASLGLLTAGVAHEINTPLGVMKSNFGMMTILIAVLTDKLKSLPDSPDQKEIIKLGEKLKKSNEINQVAAERIIDIVNKLKNFSRLDEAEWKEVNLHEGIESVLALTHHEYKYRIQIQRNYGNIPLIKCIPSMINQVVMNLLVNAIQAIEGEGEIKITTEYDDQFIFLKIRDTGKGIPEELHTRIFDPGFTTKGVGVGTGLGLAICYNVVQKHQGEIYFTSQIGMGTEFIIKLPIGFETNRLYTQVS